MFRSHNAAEVNDFDPRTSSSARRRSGSTASATSPSRARKHGDRGRGHRPRRRGSRAHRLDDGQRARRRRASPRSSSASSSRRGSRPSTRRSRSDVFGGAASCNIAIEFGAQGPNSTNAMSCASGTIAIGEASAPIRDDYADVMLAGGAEAPLAPLCFGAFAIIRAMSTRNDDPAARVASVRQGSRRLRDGRGRGGARARGVRARQGARRAHLRRGRRLRHVERRAPHDGAASRRLAGRALDAARARRTRTSRRARSRTSTRTAARTPLNDPTETPAIQHDVRRPRAEAAGEQHEGVLRPRARRVGRDRGGDLRARARAEVAAADAQPRRARRRLRSRLHPERRARAPTSSTR